MIVSDARAFQSTLKMQIFAIGHQISVYGLVYILAYATCLDVS